MRNIAALSSRQPDKSPIPRFKTMLKKTLIAFILPLVVLLSRFDPSSANPIAQRPTPNAQFASKPERRHRGSSKDDRRERDRDNGARPQSSEWHYVLTPKFEAWRFDVAANSFFSILVFNDLCADLSRDRWRLCWPGSTPPVTVICLRR
jgi:hypothetical protein